MTDSPRARPEPDVVAEADPVRQHDRDVREQRRLRRVDCEVDCEMLCYWQYSDMQ
jgi:hypothetical protein